MTEPEAELEWREPALRKLAWWGTATGVAMLVWSTLQGLLQPEYGSERVWGGLRVYSFLVAGLLWVARGKLSYRVSVWAIIVSLLIAGAYAAFLGINPATALTFLAATLLAGTYLGTRTGVGIALFGLSCLVMIAAVHVLHPEEQPELGFLDPRDPRNWVRVILNLCFFGSFLVITAVALIQRLESTLAQRTQAIFARKREEAEKTRALEAEVEAQRSLLTLQKRDALGQLAAGIAHDYNNQLLVILAWADRLRSPEPVPERTRALALDAIASAANQSAILTRQLLALGLGAVEMGGTCVPDEVISADIKALRRLLPEDIELEFVSGGTPHVNMHESQLRQVLLNLILNARDAMQNGGVLTIVTRVEESREGEMVSIDVTDTGVGMDETTRARIFEPFFSTKGERGTGLGLSSVQLLVSRAGGEVAVTSAPDQGSTFTVRMPSASEVFERTKTLRSDVSALSRYTILVVEDDEQVRQVVEDALSEAGHTVLGTSGVTRALEVLRRHRGSIDLLFADAILPSPGAGFLIAQFREAHPSGAVLLFSGYPEEALRQRGLSGETQPVLQKPFTGAELVRRVVQEIRAQRLERIQAKKLA
jgi:signal transduction histidine kinase